MNILTYIEELYEKWDGSEQQAPIILRQIHLAMHISKTELKLEKNDKRE